MNGVIGTDSSPELRHDGAVKVIVLDLADDPAGDNRPVDARSGDQAGHYVPGNTGQPRVQALELHRQTLVIDA